MAAGDNATAGHDDPESSSASHASDGHWDDEEEEESEPTLKYSKLTSHLPSTYHRGDSASTFLASRGYVFIGTHAGQLHVHSSPSMQLLRSFKAHSASITCISTSPYSASQVLGNEPNGAAQSTSAAAGPKRKLRRVGPAVDSIYIATASLDGKVCVIALDNPEDVVVRNHGRPVHAVALSPDYRNDRIYLSGGTAAQLLLTSGGRSGTKSEASNNANVPQTGWLSSLGISSGGVNDKALHSGEGNISAISWSLSGKFIAWVNEKGIKFMRSGLHLDTTESSAAWARIGHVDPPEAPNWEGMAGVWKPRLHWEDEACLEGTANDLQPQTSQTPSRNGSSYSSANTSLNQSEKLLVGWGDTIWVIKVQHLRASAPKEQRDRRPAQLSIPHHLRIDNGIISDLAPWSKDLVAVLVYLTPSQNDDPSHSPDLKPQRGIRRRKNALPPDLRLISIGDDSHVLDIDSVSVSRHESLSATDYQISPMFIRRPNAKASETVVTNTLGNAFLDVSRNAQRIFSSGASIMSGSSGGEVDDSRTKPASGEVEVKPQIPQLAQAGLKLFINSPYDCLLAIKRDSTDKFKWLVDMGHYEQALDLLQQDMAIDSSRLGPSDMRDDVSISSSSAKASQSLADFLHEEADGDRAGASFGSEAIAHQKNRVADLWIDRLIRAGQWKAAAKILTRTEPSTQLLQKWIAAFEKDGKFDEIVEYIPKEPMHPKLPSRLYDVALFHYISNDVDRARALLNEWDGDCFSAKNVIEAIQAEASERDDRANHQDGAKLQEILAILHLAARNPAEALRCYIRNRSTASAVSLVVQFQLFNVLAENVAAFVDLPVDDVPYDEDESIEALDDHQIRPVQVLAYGLEQNRIALSEVVEPLLYHGQRGREHLFELFQALWQGKLPDLGIFQLDSDSTADAAAVASNARSRLPREQRRGKIGAQGSLAAANRTAARQFLAPYANTVIDICAEFSVPLLDEILRASEDSGRLPYDFSHAQRVCEERGLTNELVYLLSATGRTKEAMQLIIDEIDDVEQAVKFAKEVDEPSLWEDLVNYSMKRPKFIVGLLEHGISKNAGISTIELVQRIPSGLEIPQLKSALLKLLREHELQNTVARGAAQVVRNDVADTVSSLVSGRSRGLRIDVSRKGSAKKPCKQCGEMSSTGHTLVARSQGHVFHLACILEDYLERDHPTFKTNAERVLKDLKNRQAENDLEPAHVQKFNFAVLVGGILDEVFQADTG